MPNTCCELAADIDVSSRFVAWSCCHIMSIAHPFSSAASQCQYQPDSSPPCVAPTSCLLLACSCSIHTHHVATRKPFDPHLRLRLRPRLSLNLMLYSPCCARVCACACGTGVDPAVGGLRVSAAQCSGSGTQKLYVSYLSTSHHTTAQYGYSTVRCTTSISQVPSMG